MGVDVVFVFVGVLLVGASLLSSFGRVVSLSLSGTGVSRGFFSVLLAVVFPDSTSGVFLVDPDSEV